VIRTLRGVIGTLVAAFVFAVCSLSCCIAPLIFILFGATLSFSSAFEILTPFRPLFVLLSLGGMGYGYWRLYVSKKPFCADSFISIEKTKLLFWLFAALTTFALIYPYIDGLIFGGDE